MASNKKSTFSILRSPVITEKAAIVRGKENSYVFEVHPDSNRQEVKAAVEKIFKVKVRAVRTVNCLKKQRGARNRQPLGLTWKKAYVSLEKGNTLDVVEGL